MGETRTPQFVTPLVAMLAGSPAHFAAARSPLEKLFGPVELESELYPFSSTAYYTPAMGARLQRQFFSFQRRADPGELSQWKLAANRLERELAPTLAVPGGPVRPINLDPGYVTGAKLVLASTKDFAHRLYLRDGIFAEITLSFSGGQWATHAFTFPDFRSGIYNEFLSRVRDRHLRKVKHARAETADERG
jgi:hypothetical protein